MYILLDENNYIKAMSEDTRIGGAIEIDLPEEFNREKASCYKIIDNEFIFDSGKETDYDLNPLRAERVQILQAFDIYKTNVLYGIEEETNKEEILEWYRKLLDLDSTAFSNIPEQIEKYM